MEYALFILTFTECYTYNRDYHGIYGTLEDAIEAGKTTYPRFEWTVRQFDPPVEDDHGQIVAEIANYVGDTFYVWLEIITIAEDVTE